MNVVVSVTPLRFFSVNKQEFIVYREKQSERYRNVRLRRHFSTCFNLWERITIDTDSRQFIAARAHATSLDNPYEFVVNKFAPEQATLRADPLLSPSVSIR